MPPRGRRTGISRTIANRGATRGAARCLAALALLLNLLVHLSPLWVPAAEAGGIEICTAYGPQIVPAGEAAPAGQPDDRSQAKACPVCAVHAAVLFTPTATILSAIDATVAVVPWPEHSNDAGVLAAGFNHRPRAPPVPS